MGFKYTVNDWAEDLRDQGQHGYLSELRTRGILPSSARQVSLNKVKEKSIHLSVDKYHPQYANKQFVDVYNRNTWVWNLVSHGESYPTIFEDGQLKRAGCGYMFKGEGLGCLNVDKHQGQGVLVKLLGHKCMRPQCPLCYEFWAAREAYRISEKFRRVPKLSGEMDCAEGKTKMGKPIHIVVSVPEAEAYLMDLVEMKVKKGSDGQGKFVKVNHYKKLKKKMNKVAKMVGFVGGCAIFHPFANDEQDDKDVIDVQIDPHSGKFEYKALKAYFKRENKKTKLWYIRPHFHLIGYAPRDWKNPENDPFTPARVAKMFNKTGWVVKNLGVRGSVMNTALYQLSHAGYREGQHTVSWIGVMSNRTYCELDPLPELPPKKPECPECGDELKPVQWVGEGPSPLAIEDKEGLYWVDPEGWEYFPDVWHEPIFNDDGYEVKPGWMEKAKGYHGSLVKPTEDEKARRRFRMERAAR